MALLVTRMQYLAKSLDFRCGRVSLPDTTGLISLQVPQVEAVADRNVADGAADRRPTAPQTVVNLTRGKGHTSDGLQL